MKENSRCCKAKINKDICSKCKKKIDGIILSGYSKKTADKIGKDFGRAIKKLS